MAKRRRPDPAITAKWVDTLRGLARKLAKQRQAVADTEAELGDAVRAAFDEGVLVGPQKEATGLSGSRLYQIKFQLRDEERDNVS